MLRSMSMHNFIHFRDRQELKFKKGANFIIGANSTGKTACFELLRRCLSNKLNITTSSIPNKVKLSYAVCHIHVLGMENFPDKDVKDVIACLFVEKVIGSSSSNQSGKNCTMYKAICNTIRDGTSYAYVQKSLGWYGCLTKEFKETSYYRIELGKQFSPVDNIVTRQETKKVEPEMALFDKIQETTTTMESVSKQMDDIYKWLEDRYVGVMPMRSIGPLQWTRSSNYQSDENYEIACKRAEILSELLHSDKIDNKKEEMYHQNLIFPFEFTNTENGIYVNNREKDTDSFPLLKCPEGILEAKQLSLILSHKEFATITLEEPDRGMHPHMIKKMRDLVLRKVEDKTVLIITHNPSMVNQWSMGRSFIFSKTGKGNTIVHNIREVDETECTKYGRNNEMKCLLFSPRVFFVEGFTDKLVFEAIFSFLTTHPKSPIVNNRELKEFLLATEVMDLQSATHGMAKMEMCDKLMKKSFVLYDFDQFTNNFDASPPNKIKVCGDNANVVFDKEYLVISDFLTNDFDEFEKACEQSNVFCWNGGDLEDQIIKILDKLNSGVLKRITEKRSMKQKGGKVSDKKLQKTTIKKNLTNAKSTDIDNVAETLVQHLDDFRRFQCFLEKIFKTDMPTPSEKRKSSNEDDTAQMVPKRQKSDDSEDLMSVDSTQGSTSFQSPELLHSGVSLTFEQIDLEVEDDC